MRSLIRYAECAVGVAALVWSTGLFAADNISYVVLPVTLHDGYAIDGGYITTSGAIGQLDAADIVDYEVPVSGDIPYVFSPSNPGGAVEIRNVVEATRTVIQAGPGFRASNRLELSAQDNTRPDCTDCEQNLEWNVVYGVSEDPSFRHISYSFHDFADGAPSILSSVRFDPPERIIIAIAPADFNSDGAVDGADFLAWQRGESFEPFSADDLTAWTISFGMTLPVTSAESQGVPEPASVILIALALLGSGLLAKRLT